MTTIVTETSISVSFTDSNGNGIEVFDVKDGWAEIVLPSSFDFVSAKYSIIQKLANEYIEFISGCFTEKSNFRKILFEKFGKDPNSEFKGFEVTFKDYNWYINAENSNVFQIGIMFETWTEKCNEDFKKENCTRTERIRQNVPKWFPNYKEINDNDIKSEALGVHFIMKMEDLIKKEHLEFSQAADWAYENMENFDGPSKDEVIKFLEKYWTRGEELKNWYEKNQKDNIKKLTNLL